MHQKVEESSGKRVAKRQYKKAGFCGVFFRWYSVNGILVMF